MNLQWLDISANSGKLAQFKQKDDAFTVQIPNDEVWKDFTLDGGKTMFKISNYARFKKPSGIITIGTKNRNKKYRMVALHYKDDNNVRQDIRYYVHRLVWEAFNGPIPKDKEVLHDDAANLHEDGSYRNWLRDLSIGTRKENMLQFHSHRASTSGPAPIIPPMNDNDNDNDNENECTAVTIQKRPRYAEDTPSMPTGFWLQKASGNKGCVVVVQIKRATKNGKVLYWKSPSGPTHPLPLKIEIAKKYVRWVLQNHPDMAVYCDTTGCLENQDVLSKLSDTERKFYEQFSFREQDDPYNEVKSSTLRKRSVNSRLPPDCGVTEDMLPRYCSYQPATDKRGDAFTIEGHPKLRELGRKTHKTSEKRSMSTLQKYNDMMDLMKTWAEVTS